MRKDGTAVDAAIATLFCNGVVHSHSLGIGGGFLMTIYIKAENRAYSLTAREMAPKASTENMYATNRSLSTAGAMAVAVPGELMGYVEAKNRFGNPKLSLMSLIEPSIKMCEEGFRVTRSAARAIKIAHERPKFNKMLR